MRKYVVIALIVALLVSVAGVVWAGNGPPATPGSRAQKLGQAMKEFKPKLQIMNQHRIQIREMKGEVKGLAAQIRAELKRIREAGLPLTEEELEAIKGTISEVRGLGATLSASLGEINQAMKTAREALKDMDPEPAKGAYSKAGAVQEARIAHLEALIDAMEAVLAQLKAIVSTP